MTTEDDNEVEPPRLWVKRFHDSEAEVRGVLDDIREAHVLGKHEVVRERLRAFAEAENGIFRAIALSIIGVDTFYTDLAAQYDQEEPPTDELHALSEEYARLSDDLELVLSERLNEFRNPRPGLRGGFRYSESTELPRLDYDLYSGDVHLCQFIHPPSQALIMAQTILNSTRKLLEQVEANDNPIAHHEQERIAMIYERLQQEISEMDGIVAAAATEPTESSDLDPVDDWSFY